MLLLFSSGELIHLKLCNLRSKLGFNFLELVKDIVSHIGLNLTLLQ